MAGFFNDPWWLCNGALSVCPAGSKRDITIQHLTGSPLVEVTFPKSGGGFKTGNGFALTDGTDPKKFTVYFFEPDADFGHRTAHYVGQVITHDEPGGIRTTTVQGRRLVLQTTVSGLIEVVTDDDWTSNRPPA